MNRRGFLKRMVAVPPVAVAVQVAAGEATVATQAPPAEKVVEELGRQLSNIRSYTAPSGGVSIPRMVEKRRQAARKRAMREGDPIIDGEKPTPPVSHLYDTEFRRIETSEGKGWGWMQVDPRP